MKHQEPRRPWLEMSFSELIDKLTILRIKVQKVPEAEKALKKQIHEIDSHFMPYINENFPIEARDNIFMLEEQLYKNNLRQWEYEDAVLSATDPVEGLKAAKMSRSLNMNRAEIKRHIDIIFGAKYLEVKKYADIKQI